MSMKPYAPQVLNWTALEATVRYITLDPSTDRHQLEIYCAAALGGAGLAVDVGTPASQATAAASVAAADWVPEVATTVSVRRVVVAHAKYLRVTPPGGGAMGQIVRIAYQPLPSTGP